MTQKSSFGNSIFDIWLNNQEQYLKAQSAWMSPPKQPENPFINAGFLDRGLKSWQQCEEQYQHWMQAAENWTGHSQTGKTPEDYSAQALSYLMNPTTFMQSGYEMMEQVFSKLVNGPEFADIGQMENKLLKSGADWEQFRSAGQRYQNVISDAWLRAHQVFSDEVVTLSKKGTPNGEALLQLWLKIADRELVQTLRSEKFLEAQRDFFSAGSTYRLRYREFVEAWCESNTLPTRSEIDELHKIVYELRREIRALKKQQDRAQSQAPVQAVATQVKAASSEQAIKVKAAKIKTPKAKAGKSKKAKAKAAKTKAEKPKKAKPDKVKAKAVKQKKARTKAARVKTSKKTGKAGNKPEQKHKLSAKQQKKAAVKALSTKKKAARG